jgi:hypothetical protein
MDREELDDVVTRLQAQPPQAQTGGGATPAVSREHLKALASTAAEHLDATEGPADALTPEQRKARWTKIFGFISKLLPVILGIVAGAAPQAQPPSA